MKFNNNNTITSNLVNNSAHLLSLSIKRARKALGLDINITSTPSKIFKSENIREVVDVCHVIGKIEVKKVKAVKKIVEIKKVSKIGQECAKFATPLDYLHSCYKKKEIVTATKPIATMKREFITERIVTLVGFSPKLIKVGKVERPTPTQKKGVVTPTRPVQMKRVVRLEKGMTNLGYFLSLGVIKGERHYNASSPVGVNVHIDRIADFLSHGDAITKVGSKINVVFCKDGIEIVGHASKEKVHVDGISYKWSYECEFISTLIAVLKRLGFIVTGVDGNRQVVIPSANKIYKAIKLIVSGLADKCVNIIMDTADRAMNVVAGDVKVSAQMCALNCNYHIFDSEMGWNLQVDKYGEKVSFLVMTRDVFNYDTERTETGTEVEYYNFKTDKNTYVTEPREFTGDTWKCYRFRVGETVIDCDVCVLSNIISMTYMSTKDGMEYKTEFVDSTAKMLTILKNIWYKYVNSQINLQMCARTDEIQGVGSYAAYLMVNNGMWVDRIESEIHDPSYEECLSVIHCFDWTWGAGANEQNMPTMDSVYRALYQLDALKDMGAGKIADQLSCRVIDCCKERYISFCDIYRDCVNNSIIKEELNAYINYLIDKYGYVASIDYVTRAIYRGAPFSLILEQIEHTNIEVNKFFRWAVLQNVKFIGYDMTEYFKQYKAYQRASYYYKKMLPDNNRNKDLLVNKMARLSNSQLIQLESELNKYFSDYDECIKSDVLEASIEDVSNVELIYGIQKNLFDRTHFLSDTITQIVKYLNGQVDYELLQEMSTETSSECFNYYDEFKAIKQAFLDKFKRVPSIICDIVKTMRLMGVSVESRLKLVNNYHVKSWKRINDLMTTNAISSRGGAHALDKNYKIWLHLVFGADCPDILTKCLKISDTEHENRCHIFASSIKASVIENDDLRKWFVKHVGANAEVLNNIGDLWNVEGFPKHGKSSEMYDFMVKNAMHIERESCLAKWPELGWGKFKTEIPMTAVPGARILDSNEELMTSVGHLSVCCQTRGGAGEACMLASMTHPKSSVLMFYRLIGGLEQLIAQAWCYEVSKDTFVLDNIEFANNRPMESILESLTKWLIASPYKNIQLGIGYCEEIANQFPNVMGKLEYLSNYNGYTDAHNRVWLKRDNKLQGILVDSYTRINLQMCASSATCNYSEVTLDMDDKTVNSIIKTIQKIERKAYPKNMRMMQGKYNKNDIVDYCECDSDQLRLFVGDNWYIILAVRDYEVEVVDIASIGNMSRAMYSCMKDIIKDNNDLDFVFDARESTSFKFAEKLLSRYGYQTEESNVWDWDGENMHEIRMVKCMSLQMCANSNIDIHISTNIMECIVDGERVFGKINCIGMKKGPSCSLFTSSPKHTELRGLVIGAEEAVRLGYTELTFVNISKRTIKLLKYGCPAIEGDIFRTMFEKQTEGLNVNFVDRNEVNLQLFADNNTGSSVPETNGSGKEVQKETSSHKEGVAMTTIINTDNNNTIVNENSQLSGMILGGVMKLIPHLTTIKATFTKKETILTKHKSYTSEEFLAMILNYGKNLIGDNSKKVFEKALLTHVVMQADDLSDFDMVNKSHMRKLVVVHENRVNCENDIVAAAIKDVNTSMYEDIFNTVLIMNSPNGLAKLIGTPINIYGKLMSSRMIVDEDKKTVTIADVEEGKFIAREQSISRCNDARPIGNMGDTTALTLVHPGNKSGYTTFGEKFARNFKIPADKKFKFVAHEIEFLDKDRTYRAEEVIDIMHNESNIYNDHTFAPKEPIMIYDGNVLYNEFPWDVTIHISQMDMLAVKRDNVAMYEFRFTMWLHGQTCLQGGCKVRGVLGTEYLSVTGDITKFDGSVNNKSVALIVDKNIIETDDGTIEVDASMGFEGVKAPTAIMNNMIKNGGYRWVNARIFDYANNCYKMEKCLLGRMNLGIESPTAEGRGAYKTVRENLMQAIQFVNATRSLKGLIDDKIIKKITSRYLRSINKNTSRGIRLINTIQGTTLSNMFVDISVEDFAKLTDREIIANEKGYKISAISDKWVLDIPIYIPRGRDIYKFFTFELSDIQNNKEDDVVAMMTKAENPSAIREMKGGLKKLIRHLRTIAMKNTIVTDIDLELARQDMLEDANNAVEKYFSAEFDGGCFTVIYAEWLTGDVCGLANTTHKYGTIGRQPYTNYWLNFAKILNMKEISVNAPFEVNEELNQNIIIVPMSKSTCTNGDSDGDFAIIKFWSEEIALAWFKAGLNAKLEKFFEMGLADPKQKKLNKLLKPVNIDEFFTTKIFTHSFETIAHYAALAVESKNNTRTTTSLAYNLSILMGLQMIEENISNNKKNKYIACNAAAYKKVQDAIDGIKSSDATAIKIKHIRKLMLEMLNGGNEYSLAKFNKLCKAHKVSTLAITQQAEVMSRTAIVLKELGLDAKEAYESVRELNQISSGKYDCKQMLKVKLNEAIAPLCPDAFKVVDRYLKALKPKVNLMSNEDITGLASSDLKDRMGITADMLKVGVFDAISDKEREHGATYAWILEHIVNYLRNNGHGHKSWNELAYIACDYIMSEEFEKPYEFYNENREKEMSILPKIGSFVLTLKGRASSANTSVSGKLPQMLKALATGDINVDKATNKRMTRIVIGYCMLAIALQKGSSSDGFYFITGSNVLSQCGVWEDFYNRAKEAHVAKIEKLMKEIEVSEENKSLSIEDCATLLMMDCAIEKMPIDLTMFSDNSFNKTEAKKTDKAIDLQLFASTTKHDTIDKVSYKVWHKAIQPNSDKMEQILQAIETLLIPYAHESVRVINRETLRLLEINIEKCKKHDTVEDKNTASLLKEIWQIVKHAATREVPRVTPVYIMEWYAKFRSTTHSVGKATNVEQKSFRLIGVDPKTTWCLIVTDKKETYPVTMFLLNSNAESYMKAKLTTYKLKGSDKLYYYGIIDKGLDTIDFSEEIDRDAIIAEIQNSGKKLSKL